MVVLADAVLYRFQFRSAFVVIGCLNTCLRASVSHFQLYLPVIVMRVERKKRLCTERKAFRQYHPWGFVARPRKMLDGSRNLKIWDCIIPGLPKTAWENGRYKLTVLFSKYHPIVPPICAFWNTIYHPNVMMGSGIVVMDLLEDSWNTSFTITDILISINRLLAYPEMENPVNEEALQCFIYNREEFDVEARIASLETREEEGDYP